MLSARSALQAPTGAALVPQPRQPLAASAQRPAAPAVISSSVQQQLGARQASQALQQRRQAASGARRQRLAAVTMSAADVGKKTRVLMVCLGNICRSPSAEAVFKSGEGVRQGGREGRSQGAPTCRGAATLLALKPSHAHISSTQWWSGRAWRTSLRSTAAARGEAPPTGTAPAASGACFIGGTSARARLGVAAAPPAALPLPPHTSWSHLPSLLPSLLLPCSYHEGDPADSRMTTTAAARGVTLTSRSRPLTPADLAEVRCGF